MVGSDGRQLSGVGPGGYDFFTAPTPQAVTAPGLSPTRRFSESGLTPAVAVAVALIGLGLSYGLSRLAQHAADPTAVIDQSLRRALVLTLVFYVLLGGALAVFCVVRRVGLTWVRGRAADALLLGLPLGLLGGGLAVALNSAVAGQLTSDPNVELLVGGGGSLRVLLTLVVTAALAPLVEETLFRGVLAGTLVAGSVRVAAWSSAIAFGVWHMNLVSLRYYVLMGLLLFWLWHKRGLVASMTAHAAFNGVLTIAAVVATGGSGHLTHVGALAFSMPGGWHAFSTTEQQVAANGPAGAGLDVSFRSVPPSVTTATLLKGLAAGEHISESFRVVPGSEREVPVAGTAGVTADIEVAGQPGHICQLLSGGGVYQLVMVTAGSPGAERSWQLVMRTARLDSLSR